MVAGGSVEQEGEGVEAGDDLGRAGGTSRNSMDQKKEAQHSTSTVRMSR